MKKINYAENRNVYMPSRKMKKQLLKAYKYVCEYPDYKNTVVNESISQYFGIDINNLTVTNGSLEGINLLLNCLNKKQATLFQPTFWGYQDALDRYDYKINNELLDEHKNYNITKLDLSSKKSEIIIICNPNNPTLSYVKKNELLNIIKANQDCHFIIDETMLIFDKEFETKTLVRETLKNDNLSVVISFSKFLGIAGLRTGCVFSNEKVITKIKNQSIPYSLGIISQNILPLALSDKQFLDKSRINIERNRTYLCKSLEKLGCKIIDGNTNFILVELPENIDSNRAAELLEEKYLIVRNIKESYPLLEGNWLRISLQTPKNNKLLIRKLKKIIK